MYHMRRAATAATRLRGIIFTASVRSSAAGEMSAASGRDGGIAWRLLRVIVISLTSLISGRVQTFFVRGIFGIQMMYVELVASPPTRNQ
jgi:hypothetical protein